MTAPAVDPIEKQRLINALRQAGKHDIAEAVEKFDTRKPRGRPTKLTREMMDTMLGAFQEGVHMEVACGLVCVTVEQFCKWMQMGERHPKGMYGRFRQEVQQALAYAEFEEWKATKARGGAWQGRAWRLKVRWPERYAHRPEIQRVIAELTMKLKGVLSNEDYDRALAAIASPTVGDGLAGGASPASSTDPPDP